MIPSEARTAAPNKVLTSFPLLSLSVFWRLTRAAFEVLLLEVDEASREFLSVLLEEKTRRQSAGAAACPGLWHSVCYGPAYLCGEQHQSPGTAVICFPQCAPLALSRRRPDLSNQERQRRPLIVPARSSGMSLMQNESWALSFGRC